MIRSCETGSRRSNAARVSSMLHRRAAAPQNSSVTARRKRYSNAAQVRRVRQRAQQLVGVIADTHGLMRPEALLALRDCDCIVHACDIGSAAVLSALASIAPLVAIRGNNDAGP